MSNIVTLAIPEAPAPRVVAAVRERRKDSAGLRLGILDNSKGNADHLFRFLLDALRATLPLASVVYRRKPNPALYAPVEILDELAAEADCVVSAMGD